jgi:hypothetical protein
MMKLEALFTVTTDKETFKHHIQQQILPYVYKMPYVDKIELTPFFDTPNDIQEQFLEKPIHYQLALYMKEEDVRSAFGSESGQELSAYLRSLGDFMTTAVGDTKVFYRWDLEQLRG